MACLLCSPDSWSSRVIADRPSCVVVLSDPYLVVGHILIIPKRHVEKLDELTKEERVEIMDTIAEFQEKIISQIASGCEIRQTYTPLGKEDPTTQSHLHIHLLPREPYDELYDKVQVNEKKLFQTLTKPEVQTYLAMLK